MSELSPAESRPRPLGQRLNYWGQLAARFALAFFFLFYGVAKLLGTQFIRAGSSLDRRVSELSGFELTWIYFGYSPLLSGVIAWGQIICATLLLFDRTKRVGMLGLFPILVNIVLVNFGYNIAHDTKIISCVFLALNAYLILSEFPALKRFLWDDSVDPRHRPGLVERYAKVSLAVRVLFLVASVGVAWAVLTYLKDEYMAETVLTGDWTVERVTVAGQPVGSDDELGGDWEKVCFEPAGHFSVRKGDGTIHGQYEVTGEDPTVRLRYNPTAARAPTTPDELRRELKSLSPDEIKKRSQAEWQKPVAVDVRGPFDLAPDRSRLVLRVTKGGRPYEVVLVPWVWQKH
jgi:hypothetical protein